MAAFAPVIKTTPDFLAGIVVVDNSNCVQKPITSVMVRPAMP